MNDSKKKRRAALGLAGDGKTDDREAIQRLFDSPTVCLPPGEYFVSHTLCLHDIRLVGCCE
jgi:hypothetical protein